ncbi:hypothetical protein Ancab_015610 [Ancistrocladus abbreviatus]
MEVASMASHSFLINTRMLSSPTKSPPTNSTCSTNSSCGSSLRASVSTNFFLLSSPAVSRANSPASKSDPNLSLQPPTLVPREALSPWYFLPDSTLRAALLFHIFGHTFFKRKCLGTTSPRFGFLLI